MSEYLKRKPLGRKAYGSIGHLPGSRMGPGDHRLNDGQGAICTTKPRDKFDSVIVQEKLDGSNVAAARIDGLIVPLVRAGYVAWSSKYEQHHLWARWVQKHADRFMSILTDGERACGEWLAQAHGTRYALPHEPFVLFDIMAGHDRKLCCDVLRIAESSGFTTPHIVGNCPMTTCDAMSFLGEFGFHGAIDKVEGVVYRVERNDVVEFLAKYVRPDKSDGVYLPELSGTDPVWNWKPEAGALA